LDASGEVRACFRGRPADDASFEVPSSSKLTHYAGCRRGSYTVAASDVVYGQSFVTERRPGSGGAPVAGGSASAILQFTRTRRISWWRSRTPWFRQRASRLP